MGVRGLNALVRAQDVHRDELFGAGRLVIDGSGLVYHLYFTSGLEQNRGGEYGAFVDLVVHFFGVLWSCDISPFVVFDGCADFKEKWDLQRKRAMKKVRRAHSAAERGRSMHVLPTLIWEVFRQTLDRLGVPLARCFTEADRQAAALAHMWLCPVLSDDTDFFIFPLSGGMLPTTHFRWRQVLQCGARRYIPCKRYFSSWFCEVNQMSPQLLPVFAVLAGNDYLKKPVWTGDLSSLLQWIRNLAVVDPQEVLKAALEVRRKLQSEEKLRSLMEVSRHYDLPPSPLSAYFCEGTTPPLPPQMVGKVPDWMRVPVTNAQFSSDFLDVVTSQRVGLSVVVDHKDKPSANLVSLPLRRVMYGLLLGRDRPLTVEERDRDGLDVQYNKVQPEEVPFCIKSLEQKTEEQRRQVLLDALGLDPQFHTSLPSHLSHLTLPMAATCYWLKKATPPPHLSLLKALLIGWCKGGDLRSKAAEDPDSRQSLDLDWCHWLNEWQSCFRESFLLNQLLRAPLPQPPIAQLYSGTLLHVLLHKMKTGRLENFVPPDSCSGEDYCALLAIAQTHAEKTDNGPSAPAPIAPGLTSPEDLNRPASSGPASPGGFRSFNGSASPEGSKRSASSGPVSRRSSAPGHLSGLTSFEDLNRPASFGPASRGGLRGFKGPTSPEDLNRPASSRPASPRPCALRPIALGPSAPRHLNGLIYSEDLNRPAALGSASPGHFKGTSAPGCLNGGLGLGPHRPSAPGIFRGFSGATFPRNFKGPASPRHFNGHSAPRQFCGPTVSPFFYNVSGVFRTFNGPSPRGHLNGLDAMAGVSGDSRAINEPFATGPSAPQGFRSFYGPAPPAHISGAPVPTTFCHIRRGFGGPAAPGSFRGFSGPSAHGGYNGASSPGDQPPVPSQPQCELSAGSQKRSLPWEHSELPKKKRLTEVE
ncbi:protein asteroid homolog 1-like isoform X2 [Boleophthalmus pectinirostris]|uniref:protein asteroid homolog 1-like isoform X2 n=1 Tax=Boleophthalmus pectinirostris TaxID=150288 RepID=UPI00242E3A85|nr:protein asteroid homolog 1-like isoform X2 [Boleophthalmus pectinirostris]